MAHVREQIRDAAVAALTGLPTTGDEVYPSRVHRLPEGILAALLVYTKEETSRADSMGRGKSGSFGRGMNRICALRVEGIAQSAVELDDIADDIAEEVETALAGDAALRALTKDLQLTQTEIGFTDDGGQPVAGIRMIFAVTYRTREGAPGTAI